MKIFTFILSAFMVVFLFISCEREIDIDVDNAQIKPVIEAHLSNHSNDAFVMLTYSQNLQDSLLATPIIDAQVLVTDITQDVTYSFTQVKDGLYTHALAGQIGHNYQLQIQLADGTLYTSMATMPAIIPLEGVTYKLADEALQDDDDDEKRYELTPQFTDIAGEENYFQVSIRNIHTQEIDLNVFKDLGFDGLPNTQRIYIQALPQDTLNIMLQNLDQPAYNYLYGMLNNINQTSGTPTNPISNISGNALGYFKVYSYNQEQTIIIAE